MKKIVVLLLVFVLGMMMFGCNSTSNQGKVGEIKAAGKLVVFTDPNFPPFEFRTGEEIKGVDIEIAKLIAAELGVELDVQASSFEGLLMSIESNAGDMAISGFTITEERQKSVDFSDPYIKSIQYLILPTDSELATMEDLAGKKIGVAKGYTGFIIIDDEIRDGVLQDTGASFDIYPSAADAALDLNGGRIDAVVMDELVAKSIAAQDDGLQAVPLNYENGDPVDENYGIAIAKGNEDLVEVINSVLAKITPEQMQAWIEEFTE